MTNEVNYTGARSLQARVSQQRLSGLQGGVGSMVVSHGKEINARPPGANLQHFWKT